jgi:Zn-dependent M16 (insulinase) family peptidase
MTPTSQIKRHLNGLQHHNKNDEQGFSALIVVNTPALDDSGVSHAVEHLVFRRSAAFTHPESLFQLTALTDLSINASTHYDATYYHCHSQSLKACLLGLSYLLNGLIAPEFEAEDLTDEIYHNDCYGVINRELMAQQGKQKNNQQSIIARSDSSAQRCYQYGGDIALISQLTVTDIKRYHAQYYQAQKMHLVTRNIEPTIVASLLESIHDKANDGIPYCPKTLNKALPKADIFSNKQLVRWYIDKEFYSYFSTSHKRLSHLIASFDAQLISPQYNLNNNQQFALDIIAPINISETVLAKAIACFLVKNPEGKRVKENKQLHKFSPEIIHLFNYYQNLMRDLESDLASNITEKSSQSLTEQARLTLGCGTVYPLQKQPVLKQQQKNPPAPLKPVENQLLIQLSQHLSEGKYQQSEYKHRALPTLFSPLVKKAEQQLTQQQDQGLSLELPHKSITKVFDADHSLIMVKITDKNQNLAILASFIISAYPSFLASRTQGHCYAIVSQYVMESHHMIFYSAFDVEPCFRSAAITESLKTLCKDLSFIAAALPLAKSKLSNVEVNNVTAESISQFISHNLLTSDT